LRKKEKEESIQKAQSPSLTRGVNEDRRKANKEGTGRYVLLFQYFIWTLENIMHSFYHLAIMTFKTGNKVLGSVGYFIWCFVSFVTV